MISAENYPTFENTQDIIIDLIKKIKSLQDELHIIQDTCNHPENEVKPIDERGRDIRKVCKICQKTIGYPRQDELYEYLYGNTLIAENNILD